MRSCLIGLLIGSTALTGTLSAQDADTEERDDDIDEIVVVGTPQSRYIVSEGDPVTGLDLDFLENPRNVTILPEQLILDRKITDLQEALRNVPGIADGDGFGGTNDDFFLRGFRRNAVYRNGFRRQTNFRTNLINIEYTQVIRGPASIRYGRVEPGGIVDIVTKRPLEEQRISGELRYGSFEDTLALLDYSQPVNDDISLRVVASTQDAESFRDFTEIVRDAVAVSARFQVTDRTQLELAYEFRNESRPLDRGTIAVPTPDGLAIVNEILDIPIGRRFGSPFESSESDFSFYEATVSHDFSETWGVRFAFGFEDSSADDLQSRPLQAFVFDADAPITADGFALAPNLFDFAGVFDDPTDQVFLARRLDGSRNRDTEALYLNLIVTGEIKTGSLTHRISFGADYLDSEQTRQFVRGAQSDGVTVPLFNIQNPLYTLPDTFSVDGVNVDSFLDEDLGVFFNSYTEVTDRLGVLVGFRYSEIDDDMIFATTQSSQRSSGLTPQVGVSYRITDNAAVFASYSESFEPNNVAVDDVTGAVDTIDPEIGEQIEFGGKAEFFDGRLQTSVALYRIEKVNVVTGFDPLGAPILADGQSSRGVEVSITGQPVPGMNVIASYAYTDAELDTGNRPQGVADTTFNLYTSYEVQGGKLEGLGFGGGVFHQGNRFGNNANTLELGTYTLVDASVWYTVPAPSFVRNGGIIRFQVAAKNLFDEAFFPAIGNPLRIALGTPRTVFGSISFDF
ncbi:TonB-dependent siderophore receptor [Eilatimonas milleporae]|uniref:Iron complex outermembrane receptor protein n=1 Tax=Eilatimonas milleporae TaxID=911205 RepID=A0A3M0CI27_9PROT|nr:TonB-dependent siderophore receptor [Eilatimonas milleporae]RMB08417.1 iron complex outermembrane receptor protein [Eilatimonas milleporae]